MKEVQKRGGFSDRNNIKSENSTIQLYDLDRRTRNSLISLTTHIFREIDGFSNNDERRNFSIFVLSEIYAEPIDYRKYYESNEVLNIIISTISGDSYDSVLTLVESLSQFWDREHFELTVAVFEASVFEMYNSVFAKECVGYRFVNEMISPITDDEEIKAIEEANKDSDNQVRAHLEKALEKLSDRENPDYENSIKESITAVEAQCELITGLKGNTATLGAMLKKLEDGGIKIHSALKAAFDKLYGYTCDANGIRHAGDLDGPDATFEEAKFMLVSCCAFINYLTALQAKIK